MDRIKYGRRLTFLSAYFSLVIVCIPLLGTIALLFIMQKFNPLWSIPIFHAFLSWVWLYTTQIIKLRAGMSVEDTRGWRVAKDTIALRGAFISGVGLVTLVLVLIGLFFFMLAEPGSLPPSRETLLVMEMMLSLGGIWGLLWLDRAAWEWRVYKGTVQSSECVERAKEKINVLPYTEAGMRRYIAELGWLIQYSPLIGIGLLFLPGIFLSSWANGMFGVIANIVVLASMSRYWKRARQDRAACQEELKERLALTAPPVTTTVPTEQNPLYQRLRP